MCSPELDLVVSGAADGTLLLHSLSSGAYVRSFCLPHGVPPALLCIAPKPGERLVLLTEVCRPPCCALLQSWVSLALFAQLRPAVRCAQASTAVERSCLDAVDVCIDRNALLCVCKLAGLLLVHSHTDLALHLFNLNCRHLASAGEQRAQGV